MKKLKFSTDEFVLGLTVDEPSLFLPWSLIEKDLPELLKGYKYEKVTDHYYYARSVTLFDKQLHGDIGFHFNWHGKLEMLELNSADIDYSNEAALFRSFEKVQKTLEKRFGKPSKLASILYFFTKTNRHDKEYVWKFKKVKLIHTIFDRFGMEEHLMICIKDAYETLHYRKI